MFGNVCLVEVVVADRLARARAEAARERLLEAVRPPRPPLRALVGGRLIRLGERLLDLPAAHSASAGARAMRGSPSGPVIEGVSVGPDL